MSNETGSQARGSRCRHAAPIVIVACTLALTQLLYAAEIYKTVEPGGLVVYSDRPSPQSERIVVPPAPKISDADRLRIEAQRQLAAHAEEQRLLDADAERRRKLAEEKEEQARVSGCRQARDRYLTFTEGRRVYRRDESGERVYYNSAEIDAARDTEQKRMLELCKPPGSR